MGQVRTPECELIEQELKALLPGEVEIESCQDTYTQDYIIWVTSEGEVRPIRITLDEYTEDDWKANIRQLLAQ
jgi:hypothetical protein